MRIPASVIGLLSAGALAMLAPLVASFEGFRLNAYRDPVGIPTICYGHTKGVQMGMIYSKDQCEILLEGELAASVAAVDRHVKVPMPETRRAALADFVYNVGEGNFARSSLLKKLNRGDTQGACNELLRWVYAKGKKLPGLILRRQTERDLCLIEGPYVIANN